MSEISSLLTRINAEFDTAYEKAETIKAEQINDYQLKRKRLETSDQMLDDLGDTWKPRLEAFAKEFGERAHVAPKIEMARREAHVEIQSLLAQIGLRFSVTTDANITMSIFSCDMHIQPMLMEFESHSQFEMPLHALDKAKLADWIDDCIVAFVRTYLSLHENKYYLKDHMVDDPVAHVHFSKYAAGATLEWEGETIYFIGEETKRDFENQHARAEPGNLADTITSTMIHSSHEQSNGEAYGEPDLFVDGDLRP